MRPFHPVWLAALVPLALGLVVAGPASAASPPLTLNCTKYQGGTVPASCNTTATVLTTPGAYSYADVGLQPAASTGGIIAGSTYPTGYPGASFYDAFVIQIADSQGSSISSTIDLSIPGESPSFQITNFQERLYKLSSTGGVAPFVGQIPGGALDGWTAAISLGSNTGSIAALPSTQLAAGTYVLELRGNVTGTAGGAYSGTLQLQPPPVPLPAGVWLLMSGLAGVAGLRRRQNAKPL